jgi:hypothetical protein
VFEKPPQLPLIAAPGVKKLSISSQLVLVFAYNESPPFSLAKRAGVGFTQGACPRIHTICPIPLLLHLLLHLLLSLLIHLPYYRILPRDEGRAALTPHTVLNLWREQREKGTRRREREGKV